MKLLNIGKKLVGKALHRVQPREKLKATVIQEKDRTEVTIGKKVLVFSGSRIDDHIPETHDHLIPSLAALSMTHDIHIDFEAVIYKETLEWIEHFRRMWSGWGIPQVHELGLTVSQVIESGHPKPSGGILCLSGGVDSLYASFEALEHGYTHSLLVAGADYPESTCEGFRQLYGRVHEISRNLGLNLVTVETNLRQLGINWRYFHTSLLSTCLGYAGTSLGRGGISADNMIDQDFDRHPWGNNHAVTGALSMENFKIDFLGTDRRRSGKLKYILSNRNDLVDYLSVCYENTREARNCGVCRKCINTKLHFIAAGFEYEKYFKSAVSPVPVIEKAKPPHNYHDKKAERMKMSDLFFALPDGIEKKVVGKYLTRLNKSIARIEARKF